MAAGKNHDHERRADGHGGQGGPTADRHADREDEEERAKEFNEVFFHVGGGCGGVEERIERGKDPGGKTTRFSAKEFLRPPTTFTVSRVENHENIPDTRCGNHP